MSKLEDILDTLSASSYDMGVEEEAPRSLIDLDAYKQQIKDLMLELIGEDKPRPYRQTSEYGDAQNDLRTELRQKVEEL